MLIRGLLSLLLCTGIATLANAQEPSASAISDSNNPLSDLIGVDFNNYFVPSLYGLEASANVMNIQGVFVPIQRHFFLDHIVRATMPVVTTPVSDAEYASGFGDFNVFDAFKLSKPEAKTEFGAGPLLVIPTASDDALGAGKWQLGVAGVIVRLMEGGSVAGALITWQTDIAGDADREGTNLLTFQPNLELVMGRTGFYFLLIADLDVRRRERQLSHSVQRWIRQAVDRRPCDRQRVRGNAVLHLSPRRAPASAPDLRGNGAAVEAGAKASFELPHAAHARNNADKNAITPIADTSAATTPAAVACAVPGTSCRCLRLR